MPRSRGPRRSIPRSTRSSTTSPTPRANRPAGDVPDGPFKGVPFLLKDLGAAYAGQPLNIGMQALKDVDFKAFVDTTLAERFRNAGLITFGKTNTPELGIVATTEPKA